MVIFYCYDPNTKLFTQEKKVEVDIPKTKAIKQLVYKSDVPKFATRQKPPKKQSWFVNGEWSTNNPNLPIASTEGIKPTKKASSKKKDALKD